MRLELRALAHLRQRTHIAQVIVGLLRDIIHIYSLIVLAAVIVSWVAPHSRHKLIVLLRSITEPVFEKVRAVVPATSGIDFSPMIVLIALHLLQKLI